MDRFLRKSSSPISGTPATDVDSADALPLVDPTLFVENLPHKQRPPELPTMSSPITVEVLDAKLQTLLHSLTQNITKEVGKLAHELRGEIDQLGERTDTLESKFDNMVQYVHVIEEENANLKNLVSQLQIQEDLENRERRQNLRIRGVPESIPDKEIRPYLLALFVTLAPHIPDIDWRLDRAHRSLAPKPPPGANPRDIIVRFHFYESKEALTIATRNKSRVDFKGAKIQIFNDLSPITLARRRALRPVTSHLQQNQVPYRWGFPFRLSVTKDGSQHSMRDLQECEAFIRNLGLPPIPEEDLQMQIPAPRPFSTPGRIWTPVRQRSRKAPITPQRVGQSKGPT